MKRSTLQQAICKFGEHAYLLTVSDDGPHTSNVEATQNGAQVSFFVSKTAAKNIEQNDNVSVFWPPLERGGYGIILNGRVIASKTIEAAPYVDVKITKAVFHRPGEKPDDSHAPCSSDCVPLMLA